MEFGRRQVRGKGWCTLQGGRKDRVEETERGRDKGVSPDSVPGFSHLNIHYWVGRDSLLPGLHEKTPGSTLFPLPSFLASFLLLFTSSVES